MNSMEVVLWIALFLPLAGFLFIMGFSQVLKRYAVNIIGPTTILLSFFCFVYLLCCTTQDPIVGESALFTWFPLKGLYANFSLHLDHLAMLMSLIITGVGFLIHAYSTGYMEHDEDIARYFAVMNFFIFSMLLLVLGSNLLVLFLGWEGVGLASYLLIGFWYERPAAARAAKKAFVVNRIGDLGLLLGILLTFSLFGTSDIQEICRRAPLEFSTMAPIVALLALLYFWGACGKSAQIPLHVWLPDAMEGPTPVSALIHAATMVTAGVYLVVRMHPIFQVAPWTLEVVGYVGGVTSLFAAICATSQKDIKRVLAYSTLSQLGLMFFAASVGAYFATMFHLTTHAFVKALLFLSAGNVIHMMQDKTMMEEMGGLSRIMKKTNILFLIGALSMSGIPPLAIFFSKDLIIEDLIGCRLCYVTGLLITLLTAFYLTRAYLLTFQGQSRVEPTLLQTLHEAPKKMLVPVSILGFLAVVGGLLGFAVNHPSLLMTYLVQDSKDFLDHGLPFGFHLNFGLFLSIGVAIGGVLLASYIYSRAGNRLAKSIPLFFQAFYINELYRNAIIRPLKALANSINKFFEPKVFDDSLRITADTSYKTAGALQELQSGQIRSYISWIVVGAVFLLFYFILGGT